MDHPRPLGRILATSLVFLAATTAARADKIHVKNGSTIRGKAIPDPSRADQYLVFGETGKTPMVLKKDRVFRIEPEPSVLDGYAERRAAMASRPTAEADYEVGLWCEEHRLADLATVHFEAAIKRDPAFGPAHQRLGHVEQGGKWLTASELKLAQGYTLYHGKWITAEEKEHRDADASASAEQGSWSRRVGLLRTAMVNGPEARRREAEGQLLAIDDPAAVRSIVRTFGGDPDPAYRTLAAKALGGIPGPIASAALVDRLVGEPVDAPRRAAMTELMRSKEANVVPRLAQALQSKSLAEINRAAWALGNLGAVAAVPRLVSVLITTEEQVVMVTIPGTQGGGGSGFGITGGRSIPILTGPAIGPGVVAYGATSVPASNFGGGVGISTGGGGSGPQQVPRVIEVAHQNTEVLAALTKLTGKDFGYDLTTWQGWLANSFRPGNGSARRVPQP